MSITFRLMLSLCFSMNSVEPEFVIGFSYLVFVSMLVQMAGHTATLLNTSLMWHYHVMPCHAMPALQNMSYYVHPPYLALYNRPFVRKHFVKIVTIL